MNNLNLFKNVDSALVETLINMATGTNNPLNTICVAVAKMIIKTTENLNRVMITAKLPKKRYHYKNSEKEYKIYYKGELPK